MQDVLEFRADECRAGVRGVDMQPERVSLTDHSELANVVVRTHRRRAERRTNLHRVPRSFSTAPPVIDNYSSLMTTLLVYAIPKVRVRVGVMVSRVRLKV